MGAASESGSGLEFGAESLDGAGLAIILVFYAIVAGLGIWAGWKNRNKGQDTKNGHVVGDRDISMTIGIFTMTATWVGGGYINGSAEAIFANGLLWCQSPIGYSLSMIVGGVFYAKRIRNTGATTMIDPLQKVYGRFAGALLVIPAVMGELFWSASILAALGTTLAVIINTPVTATILVSAAVAVFYTLFGGIYAVAYTDVAQLTFMMIGLFLAIPFMLTHDSLPVENIGYAVRNVTTQEVIGSDPVWIGHIESYKVAKWIDSFMMLIFGGLPWQAYFQRVLSANSDSSAQILSYIAPVGCIVLVIPSVLIGAGARVADWTKSDIIKNIKRAIHTTTVPPPTIIPAGLTTIATTESIAAAATTSSTIAVSIASSAAAPAVVAPSEAAPTEAAPSVAVPAESAPSVAAPSEAAPTEAAPTEAAPSVAAPAESAPSVATPSVAAPSEAAPTVAAPSEAATSATIPAIADLVASVATTAATTAAAITEALTSAVVTSATAAVPTLLSTMWNNEIATEAAEFPITESSPPSTTLSLTTLVEATAATIASTASVLPSVLTTITTIASAAAVLATTLDTSTLATLASSTTSSLANDPLLDVVPATTAGVVESIITTSSNLTTSFLASTTLLTESTAAPVLLEDFIASISALVPDLPSFESLIGDEAAGAEAVVNETFTREEVTKLLEENASSILPLALKYLTPAGVSYIGLGAVAAAVMSSTDSSLLSAASLLTVNVVQELLTVAGITPSLKVKGIILKVSTVLLGIVATIIAITYKSVYKLFYFCADFVYCLLFPQLTAALFTPRLVNPIGSMSAFFFGLLIRLLAGEEVLSLPVRMPWPYYDKETDTQYFPFKTVTMLLVGTMLYTASAIARRLGWENVWRNENYLEEMNMTTPSANGNGGERK